MCVSGVYRKGLYGVLAVILSLIIFVTPCMGLTVYADPGEDDSQDYSFSYMTAILAQYFIENYDSLNKSSLAGEGLAAGALVGYADAARVGGGLLSWLSVPSFKTGGTWAYSAFAGNDKKDKKEGKKEGVEYYFRVGSSLRKAGIDDTNGDFMKAIFRGIGGFTTKGAYYLAASVNLVVKMSVTILQTLNPFQFFKFSKNNNVLLQAAPESMDKDSNNPNTLTYFISKGYDLIYSLSWTVIVPIMLVFLVLTLLVIAPGDPTKRVSSIKKFVIRILFIGLGIPIMGSLYTACLDKVGEYASSGMIGADYLVLSSYVDFESWADTGLAGLSVDDDTYGKIMVATKSDYGFDGWSLTDNTKLNIRNICRSINAYNGYNVESGWDTDNLAITKKVLKQYNTNVDSQCDDLLNRYMNCVTYSPSAYEGKMKDSFVSETGPKVFFKNFVDYNTFKKSTDERSFINNYPGSLLTLYGDKTRYIRTFSDLLKPVNYSDGWYTFTKGMSTLSMYNYLSTRFDDTSALVYSSEASSYFTKQEHYSVNMVGTSGLMKFAYWLSNIVLLVCIFVLGYGYFFGMIFEVLRDGLSAIMQGLLGTAGMLSVMASFISTVLCMMIEVWGTFFVYTVVVELLVSLPSLIVQPIVSLLNLL